MRKSKLIDLIIVSEAHNVCLCYSERPIVVVSVYCMTSSVFIVVVIWFYSEGLTATCAAAFGLSSSSRLEFHTPKNSS